jgi:hypothetical protein
LYREYVPFHFVFHDVYFQEYRPDGVVDDRFPLFLDDDHIYP